MPQSLGQLTRSASEDEQRRAGDEPGTREALRTVVVAPVANLGTALAKLLAALFTGSSAMWAETFHGSDPRQQRSVKDSRPCIISSGSHAGCPQGPIAVGLLAHACEQGYELSRVVLLQHEGVVPIDGVVLT